MGGVPSAQVSSAVQLSHVSQVYGDFVALRDLTLELPAGSSVVLLGENGAGKSTLLRLLAGLAAPTHGEVHIFGFRPAELRGRIAYMGHATMLYDELTGPENLLYFARLSGSSPTPTSASDCVSEALRSVGLEPANPRRVGEYSQGMRQRASLARVLLSDPDLLLLDEPFSNLDAASAQAMITRLQQFLTTRSSDGQPRTLLLTTHQAELARPLAQITLILSAGRFVEIRGPHPPGLSPQPADSHRNAAGIAAP